MLNVIVRIPNWVGDAVMALPTIDNVRTLTGCDKFVVMARGAVAALYKNHPDVNRVVVIDDKKSRLTGPKQAAALIKDEHFDIGLLLTPSFSSALIFKMGGVVGRIGFVGDKRSFLLTRKIQRPEERLHRFRQYLYLLEKLTSHKANVVDPRLHLALEDITGGEEILKESGLSYDDKFITLAPQAVARSRRWGTANYGKLAARLIDRYDLAVILLGTGQDFEAGQEVAQIGGERVINLCGKTDLMQAAAIMSFGKLFVGNDSGLAHLAAASGSPVVVLSGADDPRETSPITKKKKIIIKDLDCISCVKNDCRLKGDRFMQCMKLITVDEVGDEATSFLR